MKLCVMRGPYLNAADAGNYYGVVTRGIDLTFASTGVALHEMRELYPKANFFDIDGSLVNVIEQEFDVIDVPDLFYPFANSLAMRHERVVHVAWDNMPGRNSQLSELEFVWKHVARSEMARQTLLYDGADSKRVRTIYGAVDTSLFHPLPLKERQNVVLFAGRNVPEKGLIHAIWAMKGLPAELWITSDWITEEQARAARGMKFRLLGRQNRIGMAKLLQSVKVLVFPSMPLVGDHPHERWTEQFGQLLIEAMACGTPVVAYDSGAIPEVLGNDTMQIQTCGDWSALGTAITEFISNSKLWMSYSEYNSARAVQVFDQTVIGEQIANWYSGD